LTLFVNGEIGNPTQAFETALQLVNVLSQSRLHGSIDQFKAAAAGDFAGDADRLEARASLAGLFASQGASPDFLNRTLAAIAATTPDDVRRVAKKYLNNPAIALVLPRDNS
jgi:predicted Zn-dependent peptidase